jgi:hypothetical protein
MLASAAVAASLGVACTYVCGRGGSVVGDKALGVAAIERHAAPAASPQPPFHGSTFLSLPHPLCTTCPSPPSPSTVQGHPPSSLPSHPPARLHLHVDLVGVRDEHHAQRPLLGLAAGRGRCGPFVRVAQDQVALLVQCLEGRALGGGEGGVGRRKGRGGGKAPSLLPPLPPSLFPPHTHPAPPLDRQPQPHRAGEDEEGTGPPCSFARQARKEAGK